MAPGSLPPAARTLVQVLRHHSQARPEQRAYTFLRHGEEEEAWLDFSQLETRARGIAALLQQQGLVGERVLLVFPPGLDFIAAFLGCLYAGAVAVNTSGQGNRERVMPRLLRVAADCQARAVLTTRSFHERAREWIERHPLELPLRWLVPPEELSGLADTWQAFEPEPSSIAFLQYTSGSTSRPRGVCVSHHNLRVNAEMLRQAWGCDEPTAFVSWLPLFHDMGLIGMVLQSLYQGRPCVLMSPQAFLQKPVRWLRAISRYRATISGGPDFGYALCTRKVTEAEREGLELSCWRVAFNGAEPISAHTLARFAQTFQSSGFRANAVMPSYGLAEATLLVSGRGREAGPRLRQVDAEALEAHRVVAPREPASARTLVSCGPPAPGLQLALREPHSGRPCAPGTVGEICVRGESVTAGYWHAPEETARSFRPDPDGQGPWLHTGDLGFIEEGELYVTGRLKDLIIIRGRNLYPQDVEQTLVELSERLPWLCPGGSAAASLPMEGEEGLLVVQEVDGERLAAGGPLEPAADEALQVLRAAIAEAHGVQPSAIALLKKGTLPRTTSGKVQRHACREGWLRGTLALVRAWRAPVPVEPALPAGGQVGPLLPWLCQQLGARLGVPALQIDPELGFAQLGLDSQGAVELTASLSALLGREVPPTAVYDYPTPVALVRALTEGPAMAVAPSPPPAHEPLAVVGMACRFPGAADLAGFWRLLTEGREAIGQAPPERWSPSPEQLEAFPALGRGGFLEGLELFDLDLFHISPAEAQQMDPQQRLLLEVTWEALEHAELPPQRLAGSRTGVFIGISSWDYQHQVQGMPLRGGTGLAHSIAANRISHFWDLRGPSLAVDTACSSSLVALDLACASLRGGQCDTALVGGVNVVLNPALTLSFAGTGGMLSQEGRCRTFDAQADGYVRGEGCGVVVLKRLSEARRQGDRVLAVVRGSAVGHGGHTSSLTAPSGPAEAEVIQQALQQAGVRPEAVSYVEAHGTGTALGDPIELGALAQVFGGPRPTPLLLGSVKTNIGHLEAAAGMAGLIKVVLSLMHRSVPPHLHLSQPNPRAPWQALHSHVPARQTPWPSEGPPRLAGVSSFGFGGTNAHVVLQEAPAAPAVPGPEAPPALLLSARGPQALRRLVERYARLLEGGGLGLGEVCTRVAAGRAHLGCRLAIPASSPEEVRRHLEEFAREERVSPPALLNQVRQPARLAMLFPGQGAQYERMGAALRAEVPAFRELFERCARMFDPFLDQPLLRVLDEGPAGALDSTLYAQPALFCLEYALARLWMGWGVVPEVVVGHSLGEYVAATVAGALTLEQAVQLVGTRAQLFQEVAGSGAMAAVFCTEEQLRPLLAPYAGRLHLAAFNAPKSLIVSGESQPLNELLDRLEEEYIVTRPLRVTVAGHSHLLEPIRERFLALVRGCRLAPLQRPLVSTLTGKVLPAGTLLDAEYWWRQLREPVRFHAAVQEAVGNGYELLLEVGPGDALTQLGRSFTDASRCTWVPSQQRELTPRTALGQALTTLYARGARLGGPPVPRAHSLTELPTYPFTRRHCWTGPSRSPGEGTP
jgi:acyl transferase domain-containing protein/acyl-CoA synthetase (AMP-forming)/AMP-acid ligase II/acyl carrier protein